jgi:hypothetical protein
MYIGPAVEKSSARAISAAVTIILAGFTALFTAQVVILPAKLGERSGFCKTGCGCGGIAGVGGGFSGIKEKMACGHHGRKWYSRTVLLLVPPLAGTAHCANPKVVLKIFPVAV